MHLFIPSSQETEQAYRAFSDLCAVACSGFDKEGGMASEQSMSL